MPMGIQVIKHVNIDGVERKIWLSLTGPMISKQAIKP